MSDIANEITNSIPRDGSAPPTGPTPWGNFKLTGLGAATLATDAAQYQQIQSGASLLLTAVAGTNTITANLATPTLTAYATGNLFRFVAAGANTGATTLNVNSIGAKAITKNGTTALASGDIPSGAAVEVFYDGTQFQLINVSSAGLGAPFIDSTALVKGSGDATKLLRMEVDGFTTATTRVATWPDKDITVAGLVDIRQLQPIAASVAASALTITLNPTSLDFRSTTLGSGTITTVTNAAAISVVVPSTATLGTVNAVQSRLIVLAINNAGTMELAVVNLSGGTDLSETGVISTTAIAAASNSATVIYSTTARATVAYRIVGYVESTQATAGTWATPPSTIQGYGGQAVATMSSFGFGQTWQQVTGSRALTTTYYNTTGKPISVHVSNTTPAANSIYNATVNGVVVGYSSQNTVVNAAIAISFNVPAYASYSVNVQAGTPGIGIWSELR